jgi:nitrate/TMAO reductase-like tetraheme cytochrome c subunit
VREAVERFLAICTSNLVSLIGTGITTASAFLFVLLLLMHVVGEQEGGPYAGILTFLILPALFLLGLVLIPVGIYRDRARRHAAVERGEAEGPPFAVLDFNKRSTRKAALVFLVATGVNALILGIGTYKGVEVMESTTFCGAACHTVMEPEYTTYQRSPHARVKCVECHIGAGADWFVKSKLSGSWQVISVAFNLYPRPIETPVHNLRPARETCEECHWPHRFVGDLFKVNTHFEEDEANTEVKTVLVVKVGGQERGRSHGIHWHVDPDHVVRYRADEKRQTMYEIEMTDAAGETTVWKGPEADSAEAEAAPWRTMDCIDCHNRPSHVYRMPAQELDAALSDRRIDPSLPFIRREAQKALEVEYPSHEAARAGIAEAITTFYEKEYPDVARDRTEAVAGAAKAVGDIYAWNVFPDMNVTWGTYPNHIGHPDFSTQVGCFRCHGGEHETSDGDTISMDCTTCHSLLAEREEHPEILESLTD